MKFWSNTGQFFFKGLREISAAVDLLDLGWPAVAVRAGVGLVYSVLIEESSLHVQWEGALQLRQGGGRGGGGQKRAHQNRGII